MYHSIINSYNSLLTRIFDFSSDTEKIKHNLNFVLNVLYHGTHNADSSTQY